MHLFQINLVFRSVRLVTPKSHLDRLRFLRSNRNLILLRESIWNVLMSRCDLVSILFLNSLWGLLEEPIVPVILPWPLTSAAVIYIENLIFPTQYFLYVLQILAPSPYNLCIPLDAIILNGGFHEWIEILAQILLYHNRAQQLRLLIQNFKLLFSEYPLLFLLVCYTLFFFPEFKQVF